MSARRCVCARVRFNFPLAHGGFIERLHATGKLLFETYFPQCACVHTPAQHGNKYLVMLVGGRRQRRRRSYSKLFLHICTYYHHFYIWQIYARVVSCGRGGTVIYETGSVHTFRTHKSNWGLHAGARCHACVRACVSQVINLAKIYE